MQTPLTPRAVSTLLAYLSPSGGFAGGAANSHLPHLLPTYAAVCALAIAGSPGPGGGWDELVAARQDIYDFFMRCKHPHGGFVVCDGGEIDVRCVGACGWGVVLCYETCGLLINMTTAGAVSGTPGQLAVIRCQPSSHLSSYTYLHHTDTTGEHTASSSSRHSWTS